MQNQEVLNSCFSSPRLQFRHRRILKNHLLLRRRSLLSYPRWKRLPGQQERCSRERQVRLFVLHSLCSGSEVLKF